MPRHDRHDYRLHLVPAPELDTQPDPMNPPGYEHWGLTNTTRPQVTPKQERNARGLVVLVWWVLVPLMLLSFFYARELRAFFN